MYLIRQLFFNTSSDDTKSVDTSLLKFTRYLFAVIGTCITVFGGFLLFDAYTDINLFVDGVDNSRYGKLISLAKDAMYIGLTFLVSIYLFDLSKANKQKISEVAKSKDDEADFYSETNKHLDRMIWRLSFFEKFWIVFGLLCVFASGHFAYQSYQDTLTAIKEVDLEKMSATLHYILLIKGIFLTSIPAALATYSFRISRAYIHERLKRQERKHAIHFGKLILTKFDIKTVKDQGIAVDELVDLFQWNIANDTAFSKHDYNQIETNMIREIYRAFKQRGNTSVQAYKKTAEPV